MTFSLHPGGGWAREMVPISCSLILQIVYPTDNILHTTHSLKARSCASVGWRLNSQRFKGSWLSRQVWWRVQLITGLLWPSPYFMLWFQWHLPFSFLGLSLCVSALLRMLFAPPRSGKCSSNHSPAFSSMTGAHPLSDLAGSQMLPDFPRLAPHAPVLKSSVTKLLGLLKSDYPCERIIPSDTLFCLHVWTSSLGLGSEPLPMCLLHCSLFLGVWSCQELQDHSHWSGQIQTTVISVLSA